MDAGGSGESGIRPINNIVDITNYVMLESNQPLHAFDYRLLSGDPKKIVVRRAKDGELFTTLDGVERKLDHDMLVITDGNQAIALAGIMGGENTEIRDDTVDVLLESANFSGPNNRRTGRKLAIRTDSSQRFEKGLDVNGVIYAVNRAAALMQELADGKIARGICDAFPHPEPVKRITLRPERVNYLLGTELTEDKIVSYLERLEFRIDKNGSALVVEIPGYRPDITMEVDLIEEVARLYGYENIAPTLPAGSAAQGGLNPWQKFRDQVKNLAARSLFEVVTYSFINPAAFDALLINEDSPLRDTVVVANPLSEEQGVMRTLLLPGLLATASTNLARKNENLAFFEMGSVFMPSDSGLPIERLQLGGIVSGSSEINWLRHKVEMDFFYLKGILEDIFIQLGINGAKFVPVRDDSFHPGRTARIIKDDLVIGILGEIHPLVLENYDIKQRCCAFELDMEKLFSFSQNKTMMEEITRYPAVERDIAVLMSQEIEAGEALQVIAEAEKDLLRNIVVFDIYTGEQVPEGFKSVAFKMTFQSSERTLTEADINQSMEKIINSLEIKLKATRR